MSGGLLNRDRLPVCWSWSELPVRLRQGLIGGIRQPGILLVLVCLYLAMTQNAALWTHVEASLAGLPSSQAALIRISVMLTLICLCLLLLGLPGLHRGLKPVLSVALLISPVFAYFTDRFDTVFDPAMMTSALQTTSGETLELLSRDLFNEWIVWGLLPTLALSRVRLRPSPLLWSIAGRLALVAGATFLSIGWILGHYQLLSFWGREHRELRLYVNPVYPVVSGLRTTWRQFAGRLDQPEWQALGHDARLQAGPRTLVLVVGETARADHFGLNGYSRNTTPALAARGDVISFADVTACGTYTALSVPCMFSRLGRDDWNASEAAHQDNLLDILSLAGAQTSWVDNDGGCKGVCERIESENLDAAGADLDCAQPGCTDLALLSVLRRRLDAADPARSQLIVLHQFGSHGPAYHRRLPPDFPAFEPACRRDQPTLCARQEVVNAYDSTILLTDTLLNQVIAELETRQPGRPRALVYISDHGESLGENGVYLHGLPYPLAPAEQKKIPLLMWLSPEFRAGLDRGCVVERASAAKLSHDHLFDLVAGLMGMVSSAVRGELDPLADCRISPLQPG